MVRKPSMGRQKIEIKMIEKNNPRRQVTFSKRKHGLFKKASELCILCGAEVAILVFSPAGKVYSIGIPEVEMVLDRFHNGALAHAFPSSREPTVRELRKKLTDLTIQLEGTKKRGLELRKMRKASQEKNWWEKPIEDLNLSELKQLHGLMGELKTKLVARGDEILMNAAQMNVSDALPPRFIPQGNPPSILPPGFMTQTNMSLPNAILPSGFDAKPAVSSNNSLASPQGSSFGFGSPFYSMN